MKKEINIGRTVVSNPCEMCLILDENYRKTAGYLFFYFDISDGID